MMLYGVGALLTLSEDHTTSNLVAWQLSSPGYGASYCRATICEHIANL